MGRLRRPEVRRILRRPDVAGDVTHDVLEPSMTIEQARDGLRASRTYLVEDLKGDGFHRLMAAIRAPDTPRLNTIDPVLSVLVTSLRATLVPGMTDAAHVTINYGERREAPNFDNDPDDTEAMPQIEIVSTLESVRTAFDANGKLLVIDNYIKDPLPPGEPGPPTPPQAPQGGEVEFMLPMHTVILHRREAESPGLWKSPRFSGAINATLVFRSPYGPGDPKHMWIANVNGYSDDGGVTYNVTYAFQRNPETWNVVIVYRDPETGQPGKDATKPGNMIPDGETGAEPGNGSKVARIYPVDEFRDLQLPTNFFGPMV